METIDGRQVKESGHRTLDTGHSFKIVLYQPEIPANTGNIGRLCLGANAELHLIKPFRFFLNDKYLKRAGLDYWDKVKLTIHDDWESFKNRFSPLMEGAGGGFSTLPITQPQIRHSTKIYLCSTKGNTLYTDHSYSQGDIFVFGPESRGLPNKILAQHQVIKIPMHTEIRSINLCNSVSIILYEALRQVGFRELEVRSEE